MVDFKKLIEGFNGWEKESLSLFQEGDMELILINFIEEDVREDFLHNLADMLFRLKENLKPQGYGKSQPNFPNLKKDVMRDINKIAIRMESDNSD